MHMRQGGRAICGRHACDTGHQSLSLAARHLWIEVYPSDASAEFCQTAARAALGAAGAPSRLFRGGAKVSSESSSTPP